MSKESNIKKIGNTDLSILLKDVEVEWKKATTRKIRGVQIESNKGGES